MPDKHRLIAACISCLVLWLMISLLAIDSAMYCSPDPDAVILFGEVLEVSNETEEILIIIQANQGAAHWSVLLASYLPRPDVGDKIIALCIPNGGNQLTAIATEIH